MNASSALAHQAIRMVNRLIARHLERRDDLAGIVASVIEEPDLPADDLALAIAVCQQLLERERLRALLENPATTLEPTVLQAIEDADARLKQRRGLQVIAGGVSTATSGLPPLRPRRRPF